MLAKFKFEGDNRKTLEKKSWLLGFIKADLGDRPVAEIKAPELLDVLRKIERRGCFDTARRARSLAGRVFKYAIATNRAERDPSSDLAGALISPKVQHRAAILEPKRVGSLMRASDFVMAVSWLLAALIDRGPYPVLAISGEQGSAKSTFCKLLRLLVDPNAAPLRALPREERDLFIAASNSHIVAFDNVSCLPPWLSDTICRLASGGGFTARKLFSDRQEILFNCSRPVIINGIEDCIVRSDLADRCIFLTLPPISNERRQAERDIFTEFENDRSSILAVLLD